MPPPLSSTLCMTLREPGVTTRGEPLSSSPAPLVAGLSASPWLHAAAQAVPSATAATTVTARPSDVASVDAIIAALYDASTILADQKRDADRFRSLDASRFDGRSPGPRHQQHPALHDGARWWVVGLLWDTERPDKPIPPEFLPRRPSSP